MDALSSSIRECRGEVEISEAREAIEKIGHLIVSTGGARFVAEAFRKVELTIGNVIARLSYNLYDNEKYRLIEELLEAIEESFGVTDELGLKLKKMKTFMPEGKIQDLEGNEINMVNESGSSRSSLVKGDRQHNNSYLSSNIK